MRNCRLNSSVAGIVGGGCWHERAPVPDHVRRLPAPTEEIDRGPDRALQGLAGPPEIRIEPIVVMHEAIGSRRLARTP